MSDSTILYPVSNTSREEFLAERKKQKYFITGMRFFILIFILAGWEIAARYHLIDAFIFSSPTRIFKVMLQMAADKSLFYHIGITIGETLVSFVLVLIIGTLIAMLLWWCRSAADILEPYFVVLNSLPKSALAPILIVWLGNNIRTIIISAISVAVFGTILTLYTGFMEMDPDKIKLIKTLGGNRFHVLTKVLIPGNLAVILNTMKVNMGLSLVGVIIGEFLAANEGLGYLIIYGSQVFKLDWVMLSIIILCIMATVLYQLINILERVLAKKYI